MSRKFLTPVQLPGDPTQALEATPKQYVDARAVPAGGVGGQILTKNSAADGDDSWQDAPGSAGLGTTWEPVVAMGGF